MHIDRVLTQWYIAEEMKKQANGKSEAANSPTRPQAWQ